MVGDEEQFAKAKPFVALDFTTLVDKWICLPLSISIAIMLVQTTSNSLLEFCNRLMFGLPPSIHSSDSCQLWLFKNINESSLLRFIKLLQKFPMALVVQSKSSPRICQHFHHFVHSSHTYHFPYTFSLYGPIVLLPQGLSICCYSTWAGFSLNIHIAVALLPFRSSSSPQRELSDYIFLPMWHWVSHSLF